MEVQIYGAAPSLVATIQPEQVICSEITDTEARERSINDVKDWSPGVCWGITYSHIQYSVLVWIVWLPYLMWMCCKNPCLHIPPSPYMHHQTQLAETQFAYQLMRCKPIFIEQPGLKYPCWQFLYSLLFSHTFFLFLFSASSPVILTPVPSLFLPLFSALSLRHCN